MKLSQRAQCLKPSPTLAMAQKARELQAQGLDVVTLTVGEPDWSTFPSASEAGIKAIKDGFTRYTAAAGIPELREQIAKQTSQEIGIVYKPEQAVVGAGAKFVIYSVLQMLIDPNDEVLIPSPYWVSYPTMAELAGAKVKIIECDETVHFKLSAELLQKNISEKTKVLILCSPSNPTGLLYTKQELTALADVIRKYPNLTVISDDIYNKLVFDQMQIAPHILQVAPDLVSQVVIVNGASKTYAMTGWRVGWALGPVALMKPMADYFSQTTSNVTSISQKAVMAALTVNNSDLSLAVVRLEKKKNEMLERMKQLKHIKVIPPQGAFYFWLDVKACFGKRCKLRDKNQQHTGQSVEIKNSKQVADLWLEQYLLATVPGIEFGSEGYIRISIAASDSDLVKAQQRLLMFESDLS